MAIDVRMDLDVAVIGAGGAGLLAGIASARAGAKTVLFEKMKTPAKKVAISGGGRCNFTNTLDPRRFVQLFGDKHSKNLGHALRAFDNREVIALLKNYGVEGQVEKNYRLYTTSGRGGDVVDALAKEFESAGGKLLTSARVTNIARNDDSTFTIDALVADAPLKRRVKSVIVCTGGLSYPVTGSTGDGYDWARGFGHGVTPLRPALVGMTVAEIWTKTLSGLSWDDCEVSLFNKPTGAKEPQGKPVGVERAEILFTHFGISGPAILDISNVFVNNGLTSGWLQLDFFPEIPREKLDEQFLQRFKEFPGRTVARALDGMLPNRLLEFFESNLGADGSQNVTRLPKTARIAMLDQFKRLRLTATGTRGMEYGEVTAGGIEWDAIDPKTLESRKAPGLFFAGEILDLTGRCGGFNLQAAFSTGYLAGTQAALRCGSAATPPAE
jgi:predicted Rossmann fold flavoprotein